MTSSVVEESNAVRIGEEVEGYVCVGADLTFDFHLKFEKKIWGTVHTVYLFAGLPRERVAWKLRKYWRDALRSLPPDIAAMKQAAESAGQQP